MLSVCISQHVSWVDFEFKNWSQGTAFFVQRTASVLAALKHAPRKRAQLRVALSHVLLASPFACCVCDDSY